MLAGEVNAFESPITNLASVTNGTSSIPGVAKETTNELRQRLIKGNTIRYSLDGCKDALEELTGVTYARVYFNYNNTEDLELPGGVLLSPRHALIIIHGDSLDIAKVYTQYMSAETMNAADAGERACSQIWTTQSGQQVEIKYDKAKTQEIYVKIWLAEDVESLDEVKNQLKRDLITASSGWGIGAHVSTLLTDTPFVDINYTKVSYTQVSLDGINWYNHVEVPCDTIPIIPDANITVTQVGAIQAQQATGDGE